MRCHHLAVLMIPSLIAVGCMRAAPDPRAELQGARDSFVAAVLRGDARAIAASFTPDADILAPDLAPIRTRDSIQALFAGFTGHSRVVGYAITPDVVVAAGDTALENGTYMEDVQQDTTRSVARGRYMFWWVKRDGGWQIRRSLFNHGPQQP